MFDLSKFLGEDTNEKISSIPLEFGWPPGDLLAKEFTKLNSEHKYRIHYLGPRCINTQTLHKKYSSSFNSPNTYHPFPHQIPRYSINSNMIVQSFYISEKIKNNNFYKSAIYYRAFEGMNPTLNIESQYIFNSVFESGNLDCVIKVKTNQFDLFLRIDSNTRGHLNWYYFSVKNGSNMSKIKLNICNLSKPRSLYEKGLKPYIFSKKRFQYLNRQWEQGGHNISFSRKQLRYKFLYDKICVPSICTLSFQYNFQFEEDEVFFAYCVPYTYSQLLQYIHTLPSQYVNIQTLGLSTSGLPIPVLQITNPSVSNTDKKTILITARVHPAESNSSHIIQGLIDYLTSSVKQVFYLRNMTNFIIIPMVNPDGVVLGNSRTSAMGKDLNREYLFPNKQLHPQIYYIKELAERLTNHHKIFMYLDFHGHSCRKNTFLYGPPYIISQPQYYKSRILPRLIEKNNNSFRFYSCSFMISESKRKTGRATMYDQLKIPYTYTLESSVGFYYDCQSKLTLPFNSSAWKLMGSDICKAFSQFFVAYQEYEQLIRQRRLIRIQRRRKSTKEPNIKVQSNRQIIREESQQHIKQNIVNKNISFINMIEEVKQLSLIKQRKDDLLNEEESVSSDDHDEEEDLETSKMKQFNSLMSQKYQITPKIKNINFEAKSQKNIKLQVQSEEQETIKQEEYEILKKIMINTKKTINNTNYETKKWIDLKQLHFETLSSHNSKETSAFKRKNNIAKIFQPKSINRDDPIDQTYGQKSKSLLSHQIMEYRFPDHIKQKMKNTLEQIKQKQKRTTFYTINKVNSQKNKDKVYLNLQKTSPIYSGMARQILLKNKRLSQKKQEIIKKQQESLGKYLQGLNQHIRWKSERKNNSGYDFNVTFYAAQIKNNKKQAKKIETRKLETRKIEARKGHIFLNKGQDERIPFESFVIKNIN